MKKILSALVCVLSLSAFSEKAHAKPLEWYEWYFEYNLGLVADSLSGYGSLDVKFTYYSQGDLMYNTVIVSNDDPNNPLPEEEVVTVYTGGVRSREPGIGYLSIHDNTYTTGSTGLDGLSGVYRMDFTIIPPDPAIEPIFLSFDVDVEYVSSEYSFNGVGRTNRLFAEHHFSQDIIYDNYMYTFDVNLTDGIYAGGNTGFPGGVIAFEMSEGQPVAPTPEPATMLLMGVGLAGLGFVARRRQKQA